MTDPIALLGPGREQLTDLVRDVTDDRDAVAIDARVEPVDYLVGTPSTGALLRVRGRARLADGTTSDWSVFVKQLQSVRHWDHLHLVPEPLREEFVANIPWRLEIAVHRSGLSALLPDGMRLPVAYRIDEQD